MTSHEIIKLEKVADEIRQRVKGTALTGAGISAQSGISTYRDSGGLWDKYGEGAGGGILAVLAAHPDKAPEILGGFFDKLLTARPNPGHLAMAELENMGYLSSVITQNVDDLHNQAGNKTVFEMHGNMFRMRCLSCGKIKRLSREKHQELAKNIVQTIVEKSLEAVLEILPKCDCKGVMRHDFVSFGEAVQCLDKAMDHALNAKWMLIAGTSGVVHPAASLPGYAKKNGAFIVEVNPKQSELTPVCDVFLQGTAGEILPRLVEILKEP